MILAREGSSQVNFRLGGGGDGGTVVAIHSRWQIIKLARDEVSVRCRPINGFTPAHIEDGRIRYAHNTGEVNFRRRHPLQLASTLGFILNKRSGYFPGLAPEEKEALHECLTWLRQVAVLYAQLYYGRYPTWTPLVSYGPPPPQPSHPGYQATKEIRKKR